MSEEIFDNHAAFNRFQVMNGMKVTEATNQVSAYITEVKLKKAYRQISDEEIENLFDQEMTPIAIKRHREKLEKKLSKLHKWQLIKALRIYIDDEDIEGSAQYVLNCKRTDKAQE